MAAAEAPYPGPFEDARTWRAGLIGLCSTLPAALRARVVAIALDGTSGTLLLCRPDGALLEGPLGLALPYHRACPDQAPAAAALVSPLLRQGESVLVFCTYLAVAKLLQARLGGSLLTGELPPPERQRVVDRFQAGAEQLLISTYGAGGLGFTLHRARHVVLLDRPWTPGDAEQAEDRCHRIGMQGSLHCHWLQLGVADQLVDGLIASKAQRIALLLPRRSTALQRQALPQMVRQLLAEW